MFKKTLKFEDLNGDEVEQTFYFHYNRKEVAELIEFGYVFQFRPDDTSKSMPLEDQLKALSTPVEQSGLTQEENTRQAYNIFQNLILDAYGEKGDDNVTFKKTRELRQYWESHVAFPELIIEFINNPKTAAEFIEYCLPPKFRQEAIDEMKKQGSTGTTLADMVEEADRRQRNPETRIEPGLEAAVEAGVATPEMAKVAEAVAEQQNEPSKDVYYEKLTEQSIMAMPEEEFKKLDIRKIPRDLLPTAFRRKTQS